MAGLRERYKRLAVTSREGETSPSRLSEKGFLWRVAFRFIHQRCLRFPPVRTGHGWRISRRSWAMEMRILCSVEKHVGSISIGQNPGFSLTQLEFASTIPTLKNSTPWNKTRVNTLKKVKPYDLTYHPEMLLKTSCTHLSGKKRLQKKRYVPPCSLEEKNKQTN